MVAKHGEPGKLSLHFRADESGLLSLDKAESVIETTEEYTIKVPVISKEALKAATDLADNDTDAEAAADLAQKIEELMGEEVCATCLGRARHTRIIGVFHQTLKDLPGRTSWQERADLCSC